MVAATLTAVPKDKQRSVIRFLTLENVLGSEIYVRMRMVNGTECYHKINCELIGRDLRWDTRVPRMNLKVVERQKGGPDMVCCRHQQTHRAI